MLKRLKNFFVFDVRKSDNGFEMKDSTSIVEIMIRLQPSISLSSLLISSNEFSCKIMFLFTTFETFLSQNDRAMHSSEKYHKCQEYEILGSHLIRGKSEQVLTAPHNRRVQFVVVIIQLWFYVIVFHTRFKIVLIDVIPISLKSNE